MGCGLYIYQWFRLMSDICIHVLTLLKTGSGIFARVIPVYMFWYMYFVSIYMYDTSMLTYIG